MMTNKTLKRKEASGEDPGAFLIRMDDLKGAFFLLFCGSLFASTFWAALGEYATR